MWGIKNRLEENTAPGPIRTRACGFGFGGRYSIQLSCGAYKFKRLNGVEIITEMVLIKQNQTQYFKPERGAPKELSWFCHCYLVYSGQTFL